jgi:hypothetical protein
VPQDPLRTLSRALEEARGRLAVLALDLASRGPERPHVDPAALSRELGSIVGLIETAEVDLEEARFGGEPPSDGQLPLPMG